MKGPYTLDETTALTLTAVYDGDNFDVHRDLRYVYSNFEDGLQEINERYGLDDINKTMVRIQGTVTEARTRKFQMEPDPTMGL